MGKLNVKNGTPFGSEQLCKSCLWCQYTTGFRESDVIVICTNVAPSFRVPFPVHECSDFADKTKPSYDEMNDLAIEVRPSSTRLRATPGFSRPAHDSDEEDELVGAVARRR